MPRLHKNRSRRAESGYVLLAVMLTLTLMLAAMAIEAPRIAQQIKRDKEEELVHRGKDYAMAVKRFVHKSGGRYPASIEQLENTNHIRFLRKKYKDPMTGEAEWKMVHAGEAQIKIPAPNPGLPGSGNPGLSGSNGNPGLSSGTNPVPGTNPAGGATPNGVAPVIGGGTALGQNLSQSGTSGSLTTSNIGNGQTFGGGQIIGVASMSKKQSIKEFNDKDHYDEWYFVYDLRLEQSGGTGVAVAAPMVPGSGGGNPGSGGGNPTGQAPASGTPSGQTPATDTAPGQPQPTGTPTQTPPQPPNQN